MANRLLDCVNLFVTGVHLALVAERHGLISLDKIAPTWGTAKQLLVNNGGGNASDHQHLLALPAPQDGRAAGVEHCSSWGRMLTTGNPDGPHWGQDEVYVNRTRAWTSLPLAEQITPFAANGLFEATAGTTAWLRIKAWANGQVDGLENGDNATVHIVPVAPSSAEEERYEGYVGRVHENYDGTYDISYEAEVSGTYVVQARINGQRVQHCSPGTLTAAAECRCDDPVLTVVHGEMDAARCSVLELAGQDDLPASIPVGTTGSVTVISRDLFGNARVGGSTSSFAEHDDGSSDVFVVTLFDNEGHRVQTSSAVQIITAAFDGDDSVDGSSFRLEFGGAISRQLSTSANAREVQEALTWMLGNDDTVNVVVSESTARSAGGGVAWRTTFLSHLEEWSKSPLRVAPAVEDNRTMVSVSKEASQGVYPIEYTLRRPGRYGMSITDARGEFIDGGCRVVEATSVDNQPFPPTVTGDGLHSETMAESVNITITTKISPSEPEAQRPMAPTTTHELDFSHFDNSTLLEGLSRTFDLAYSGDLTIPTLFGADELRAADRDPPLETYHGTTTTRPSRGAMWPAASHANGTCPRRTGERLRRRRQLSQLDTWFRGVPDRAVITDTTTASKLSLSDNTMGAHSSKRYPIELDGWDMCARSSWWSARPEALEECSAGMSGFSVHTMLDNETVNEAQRAISDSPMDRSKLVGEDAGVVEVYYWVPPIDHTLVFNDKVVQTRPLCALGGAWVSEGSLDPFFEDGPTAACISASEIDPPEFVTTDSSADEAALSSGLVGPDPLPTHDGTAPGPAVILPAYQRPAGLAMPYGQTAPFPSQWQSSDGQSTRDGVSFNPPATVLPAPSKWQDQGQAPREAWGSGLRDRGQPPVVAVKVEDNSKTTPASVLIPFAPEQCTAGDVPSTALLPPSCDDGVSPVLVDIPAGREGDDDSGLAALANPSSLIRWTPVVAALVAFVVVCFSRPALRWTSVARTLRGTGALVGDVRTTARSFGAATVVRVTWVVGVLRSVVAGLKNVLIVGRSSGARVVARATSLVRVLRGVRAVRYAFAVTRAFSAAAVSVGSWAWPETLSECPGDRLLMVLIAFWAATRDIVRCIFANLWSDIWSAAEDRSECKLVFMPTPEPGSTFSRELARAVALVAVYVGAMGTVVAYFAIIRPKWITWEEEQQARLEDAASKAAYAAYCWDHRTPRYNPRDVRCTPEQQSLSAALQALLLLAENRELLIAYRSEQDGLTTPAWWQKWTRQWKDRQLLLELAELVKELWYYCDVVEQYWWYEQANAAFDGIGPLDEAVGRLLGTRARRNKGAEFQLFLDVIRRTFPPERCAPLRVEGQLDICSVDTMRMPVMDDDYTCTTPLFQLLGQRATPRPSWIRWSRTCKKCQTTSPRKLLELAPLRLERLPEVLYVKVDVDGLRGDHMPDAVKFRAPGSDELVRYAPETLLGTCSGTADDIVAVRNLDDPYPRKWWGVGHTRDEVAKSSPVFIILRKVAAR